MFIDEVEGVNRRIIDEAEFVILRLEENNLNILGLKCLLMARLPTLLYWVKVVKY